MAEHRFKLVADWEPAGDQPKAIDELASALERGEKRLTLLGATGTGKSLDADEPIMLFRRRDDGGWASECAPIGAFVDERLGSASKIERAGDTEISRENPFGYHVLSFNPRTCKAELKPITAFVRHEAPAVMYRVKLDCGRECLITGDHNLWVLRDGSLKLIETHEAQEGDCIPLPETLPAPQSDLEDINLLELLRGEKMYVDAGRVVSSWIEERGLARVRSEFKKHMGDAGGLGKPRLVAGDLRARGMLVDVFLKIAYGLGCKLTPDQLDLIKVGPGLDGTMLPARLRLTEKTLRLLGHYIAEGNCQPGYFKLASRSDAVREEIFSALDALGVRCSVHAATDITVGSRLMSTILSKLCGPNAREKRLPPFWGALSNRQLRWLLQAYFEGDAGVEKITIACTTASRRLASDLAYALARFGIWARINTKFKRAVNSDHPGAAYYQVTLCGQEALRAFSSEIGFISERKRKALSAILGRRAIGNVDVVPGCGAVRLYEQGMRNLRRHTSRRVTQTFRRRLDEIERLGQAVDYLNWRTRSDCIALTLNETWKPGRTRLVPERARRPVAAFHSIDRERVQRELARVGALEGVRWSKVASVEAVPYDKGFVYDVSVAENETFLGGFGGMFLHNTFTMASVIERLQKPTLVIAHNKTLAAQLCSEFRSFFPENAVHYFISYYDYYQPEAYIPRTDTYIEKDSSINDEIDRLRHAATSALFERRDVIIVASVSCIYGLGSPEDYVGLTLSLKHGDFRDRDSILRKLVGIQYERNDVGFTRGTFRVRGDVIEIVPVYEEHVIRIELFGDEVDRILELDPITGEVIEEKETLTIYPATHFITSEEKMKRAIATIQEELRERLAYFRKEGKLLEAQRLEQRTMYDLEMLEQVGVCQGIENYSRHLTGRAAGEAPATLLDYFPGDFLMFIDESHQTIPQIGAMYRGDRSRKETLVEYGFRLPSALDNRPLQFEEFEERMNQVVFVSATPGPYEQKVSSRVVEQIIRPTGLVDPEVDVRPIQGQIDDLLDEIQQVTARGERVLVTTLTKKMAEDLTDYFTDMGVRVRYLHSEIQSLERIEILRDLRLGEFDVLVGINLLREGLDLPEVSLVAILDADKEGFLRSETSLIQTIGRAARNVNGRVIMYADNMTGSMRRAIDETNRRRAIQLAYNEEHGITPETVRKRIHEAIRAEGGDADAKDHKADALDKVKGLSAKELAKHIQELEAEMFDAAKRLEFERAAELRDEIEELRSAMLEFTG